MDEQRQQQLVLHPTKRGHLPMDVGSRPIAGTLIGQLDALLGEPLVHDAAASRQNLFLSSKRCGQVTVDISQNSPTPWSRAPQRAFCQRPT